jgi:sorting nexin-1/2
LIEIWETFLMQLDAEEDEQAFYKPPVETPARDSQQRHSNEAEPTIGTGTIAPEDDD